MHDIAKDNVKLADTSYHFNKAPVQSGEVNSNEFCSNLRKITVIQTTSPSSNASFGTFNNFCWNMSLVKNAAEPCWELQILLWRNPRGAVSGNWTPFDEKLVKMLVTPSACFKLFWIHNVIRCKTSLQLIRSGYAIIRMVHRPLERGYSLNSGVVGDDHL